MKTRTRTIQVPGTHTINGQTVPVVRTETVVEPVSPRDLDMIAARVVVTLIVILTTFSVVWSTVSIARLLGGGWAATLAAAVFDAAWIVTGGMAYLVRHQPDRRSVVDRGGWVLVAVTVLAIGVEGWRTGGLATACAGAAVSLIAKGLWWMFDHATRAPLSDLDQQWVAGRRSQLGAQRALLAMQRQVAREQARIGDLDPSGPRVDPDPDRPRGSAVPDAVPAADPTPVIEAGPTRADPTPEADPTPTQVDPEPAPATKPTRTRQQRGPGLHAVSSQADLRQAKAVLTQMRKDKAPINRDEFKRRMGAGTTRANRLWAQVDPKRQAKPRRTA